MTPSARAGFTLIEVILAMAIIVFLAGALFGTMRATLSATAALNETQRSRQRIFGFFELCQQTFPRLPVAATIQWNSQNSAGKAPTELTLRQAPQAFTWGGADAFYGEIALCTHVADDGSLTLGVEQREIDPLTSLIKPNPAWLPLLYTLKNVTWRFYDSRTAQWQTFWSDPAQHPALMEVNLTFPGEDRARSQTFWLPPLAPPPAPPVARPDANDKDQPPVTPP